MTKPAEAPMPEPICTLLLFVATPTEEDALKEAAEKLQLNYRKDDALTKHLLGNGLMEDAWIMEGTGEETVGIIGCSRESGKVVMGPHGRLGSAACGLRPISLPSGLPLPIAMQLLAP